MLVFVGGAPELDDRPSTSLEDQITFARAGLCGSFLIAAIRPLASSYSGTPLRARGRPAAALEAVDAPVELVCPSTGSIMPQHAVGLKLARVTDCPPDFARTAVDYARHRAGFPPALLDRLAAMGVVRPGARVVDLGTGTGSLARLFARHGCEVTGVDIAGPLLEQARRLDREVGVEIAYVEGPAEATGLPDHEFDVISAGQCWHWFDRPAAAREVARLLVSGGNVVIAHFDWLPIKGNVVEATEEIILRYTPSWPFADRAGLYPQWLVDLQTAGFTGIETFSFDVIVSYTHVAWVGRMRASAPIAGTLDTDGVQACSKELTAMLHKRFAEDPLAVPHPCGRSPRRQLDCERATQAPSCSPERLLFATRDRRQHTAASAEGFTLFQKRSTDPRPLNARSNDGSPTNSKVRRLRRRIARQSLTRLPLVRSPDLGHEKTRKLGGLQVSEAITPYMP